LDSWVSEFRDVIEFDFKPEYNSPISINVLSGVKYVCLKKKEGYEHYNLQRKQNPRGVVFKQESWLKLLLDRSQN
jgi:hypothetical protein